MVPALFWAAEALVIVGMASGRAHSQAGEPFSEAANTWATPEIMPRPATHVRELAAMKTALEAGDYHALVPIFTKATVEQLMAQPTSFARLTLYAAPGDPGCSYLKLENFVGKRRRGATSFTIKTVIAHLRLPPVAYEELYHRFAIPATGSSAWATPAPFAA